MRREEPGDARTDDRDPHRKPPCSATSSTGSWSPIVCLSSFKIRTTDHRLGRSAGGRRRTRAPMKRVGTPTQDRPPASRSPTDQRSAGRPPIGGTSDHQSLSKYIQARFDECSRSQKDVAQYIVDHLDEAAFQTAEELARRANTSSSTVVRFSQALGFEGFPELQAAAREEYRRLHAKAPANGSSAGSTPLFSLDQNEFETALTADYLNVEDTARKVSRSSVEALIEAIVSVDKVLVAGTDQMAFFASYLRHLLMLLDLRVDVVA